jgi:dTDP-4-dehydrorhamnose reductase
MRKVVITGVNGMLGSAIATLFKDKFSVYGLNRESLPIEDFKAVNAKISEINPDIIIHCAAYTNVELAETNPADCYRVNHLGSLNIANAARKTNSKLIYISSTGCYGSHSADAYCEYDPVLPTTVYHKSKIAGENAVSSICTDYLILRTGWLYGGDISHKKNFVYNRFLEAKKAEKIISDPFQSGNPTSVDDVADQIQVLIKEDVSGIFNVVSEGYCTRYEYVRTIVALCGLETIVEKADTPFKRTAPVSGNESADNFLLRNMGLNVMKPWKESLKRYIDLNIINTP